jgi:hypothetical protein
MTATNEFASDTHRRVAGSLMRPRSAQEIADEFNRHDPYVADKARSAEGVEEYLRDLEAEGLAVNLGTFADGEAAMAAQNKDKAAIDFTGDAEIFAAIAAADHKHPFLDSADHWVRTNDAQARLIGVAPGSEETTDE